jgi:DNA-directed RNA polymerase
MATTIIEDSAARNVQLSSIIADPIFATPDEPSAAIQLLTQSAFDCLSRGEAVSRVSDMGVRPVGEKDTFLDGIEGVAPVTKRKVPPFPFLHPEIPIDSHLSKITVTKTSEGGEIQHEEFEVPFNLDVLRRNLNHFILERQMLPDDVVRRQKLLEDSAYDNALERYRHEAGVFKSMNMGGNLGDRSLQAWAWDWYNLTVPELERVIDETEEAEKRMIHRKNSGCST